MDTIVESRNKGSRPSQPVAFVFYKAQDRKKVVQFGGHFEIYLTRGENRLLRFKKQLDGNIVAI